MLFHRVASILALSVLVGCGGTFTHEGEQPGAGGSAGVGASAGTVGHEGGHGGTGATGSGGSGAYGSSAGSVSYGGYGSSAGSISYGGYGSSAGSVSYGGDGGSTGCSQTSPLGPYPVTFLFTSNTPVYMKMDCSLGYDIYGCGSSPIQRQASCVADCSSTSTGCIACGACFSGAKEVAPGAPLQDAWDGKIYKYGTLPSGCSCATGYYAAPGNYVITVSRYLTESDALMGANPYIAKVPFQLPAPMGVVSVDLGFTPL